MKDEGSCPPDQPRINNNLDPRATRSDLTEPARTGTKRLQKARHRRPRHHGAGDRTDRIRLVRKPHLGPGGLIPYPRTPDRERHPIQPPVVASTGFELARRLYVCNTLTLPSTLQPSAEDLLDYPPVRPTRPGRSIFDGSMATHCGDVPAHRVDLSDRSALSDMG